MFARMDSSLKLTKADHDIYSPNCAGQPQESEEVALESIWPPFLIDSICHLVGKCYCCRAAIKLLTTEGRVSHRRGCCVAKEEFRNTRGASAEVIAYASCSLARRPRHD